MLFLAKGTGRVPKAIQPTLPVLLSTRYQQIADSRPKRLAWDLDRMLPGAWHIMVQPHAHSTCGTNTTLHLEAALALLRLRHGAATG